MFGRKQARVGRSSPAYDRAVELIERGDVEVACPLLSEHLIAFPEHASAHLNLGVALQQSNQLDEAIACFGRALVIEPDNALALSNLGTALLARDRPDEARTALERAVMIDPDSPVAWTNLGVVCQAQNNTGRAIIALERALSLAPERIEIKTNLAIVLQDGGRYRDALPLYQELVISAPQNVDLRLRLGSTYHKLSRYDDAKMVFSALLEMYPVLAEAARRLGAVLQEEGDLDGARGQYRRAIASRPEAYQAYLNLAHISRLGRDDPIAHAVIGRSPEIAQLPEGERISAYFSLGKVLTDLGEADGAFDALIEGNRLKRKVNNYDELATLRTLQNIIDGVSSVSLAQWPTTEIAPWTPIFIVGMPRSGSTLIDQILVSHAQVSSAGESAALTKALSSIKANDRWWKYPAADFVPSREQLDALAQRYRVNIEEEARQLSGSAPGGFIVDKTLGNFRHIGLIRRALPSAKIIHTFRDPVETCLSCFTINFDSQAFSFDLGELGRYYRSYAIMMRHWREALPNESVFDVRYEAVVAHLEASARAVLNYCGLPWDQNCLRFYETSRPVRTASVEQVRRPIYQSSVKRPRPSPEKLHSLFDGLGLSPTGASYL